MADLPLATKIYTQTLENSTLTIRSNLNLRGISIFNASSVSGQVQGTASIPSLTNAAIILAENESFNVTGFDGNVLDDLEITAPAGCTLNIIGLT